MMAYIQILAIVLCSCFIQDVISGEKVRKVTAAPANDATASKFTNANGQSAAKPPTRRLTTVKRTVSRKPTAVQAPPPPPPTKYPHLNAVKDMFWNAFEDINRSNVHGKLNVRSARNMMGNVLRDELFWSSVVSGVRRRVKVTNDSQRADGKIRMCNAITTAITSPSATKGFQDLANEVYGTVSHIKSDLSTDALRLVNEMVKGGEVNRGLDTISSIMNHVKLNPEMLIKGFSMFRTTLNLGGAINMSGGVAKGLMSITSKFNK